MRASGASRRLRGAARALRDFLRGFLGAPGTPGASPTPAGADPATARRALEERAARRPACC
ncbi:MAG TPA: hypothetical protein VLC53_04860 [Myxococcota bacterium]|jgi:hypothetical protein|nr:hypothetical protein [Myxococcota bacterium]